MIIVPAGQLRAPNVLVHARTLGLEPGADRDSVLDPLDGAPTRHTLTRIIVTYVTARLPDVCPLIGILQCDS